MNYKEIKTNEKMNLLVKDMLNLSQDNYSLYALKRIEELEEQLRIANVSKSLLTCKCGNKVQDLNDGLCFPCWNERYEASK